jgi:acyl-CoA reductase-like NAD-dependent aldehyde dehydrogenase
MTIMQREIFGPLCSVVKFKVVKGKLFSHFRRMVERLTRFALEIAIDVAYGLGANG